MSNKQGNGNNGVAKNGERVTERKRKKGRKRRDDAVAVSVSDHQRRPTETESAFIVRCQHLRRPTEGKVVTVLGRMGFYT